MTGNVGEWSELYAMFKLLAEGKLYAADAEANRIPDIYYDILKVIRAQASGTREYHRDGVIKVISAESGEELCRVPIEAFVEQADKLLDGINRNGSGGAFELPDVWRFAESVKCTALKARSADKSDIKLMVHDIMSGRDDTFGFSIKSQLGSPSTLLNASGATNFVYELGGHKLTESEKAEFHGLKHFKDKFDFLDRLGTRVTFLKPDSDVFNSNLMLIDTKMPQIIGEMLENFYRAKANLVADLTEMCAAQNLCGISESGKNVFYAYKIKEFMTDTALGMMPGLPWNGNYEATGGYIIVKEDGDVLCYHIYNRNEFREYLYNNTKFETPSKERHHFGVIEETGGKQFLKLKLQIRFVK